MLSKFMEYYKQLDITITNNERNEKVAVIVEPRKHEYIIPVIKQVMSKFDDSWNLRVFGSDMNEAHIKENIKGNYAFINIGINDLVSPDAYSLLLQSPQFWNKIKEENIIIFQTDSFIINNNYEIPTQYGFLGAYYYVSHIFDNIEVASPLPGVPNICGGFSYRKKSVMIDCVNNVTYDDIIEHRKTHNLDIRIFINRFILPEDCFFHNAMVVLGYDIPMNTTVASEFCINTLYKQLNIDPLSTFGIHPFDKFDKQDIDNICGELLRNI